MFREKKIWEDSDEVGLATWRRESAMVWGEDWAPFCEGGDGGMSHLQWSRVISPWTMRAKV